MITPINLPNAAAIDYANGDVRHFSTGDALDVPSISNPTRELADRDNLLAEKVNAVIAAVNNTENIIPLPVYRMVIPADSEQVIANQRIPAGFEARVFNAIITSTPISSSVSLNVYWSQGFGATTGSSVVTTTGETAGGTTFSPTGEFVVTVKNSGATTLEIVASVSLAMRPTSDLPATLLPGPLVIKESTPGGKGEKGEKGDTGAGTPGPAGLNFRGQWSVLNGTGGTNTYNINDSAWLNTTGYGISSYRCVTAHTASNTLKPNPSTTPSAYWDWVASGASGSNGSNGASPSYSNTVLMGNGTTGSVYVNGAPDGYDAYGPYGMTDPNTKYAGILPFNETVVANGSTGMAVLTFSQNMFFKGQIYLGLPADTFAPWDNATAICVVTPNGTVMSNEYCPVVTNGTTTFLAGGTNHSFLPEVAQDPASNGFIVNVNSAYPQEVSVRIFGVTAV